MENVKNLTGKKFKADFDRWLEWLDAHGYNNYWKIMSAADYGIPQKRERVFCISVLKKVDTGFSFPEPVELTTTFADFLEDEVNEKYYINDAAVEWSEQYEANAVVFGQVERE